MDSSISFQAAEAARNNFTVGKTDFEHFLRCWAQQDCGRCINTAECSWCPYTWACVPNKHQPAFLAPLHHDDICPSPAERWELRTQPFGCSVSTYTVMSTATAVNATLLTVLVLWLFAIALRHVRRRSRRAAASSRQRVVGTTTWWTAAPSPDAQNGETQPLIVGR